MLILITIWSDSTDQAIRLRSTVAHVQNVQEAIAVATVYMGDDLRADVNW